MHIFKGEGEKNGLNNGGNCYVLLRVCYSYRKKQ